MKAVGSSVVGMKRANNEDAIYLDEENQLYLVADGMGGCSAGEVASTTAIMAFVKAMKETKDTELLDKMVGAMITSNQAVFEKAKENTAFMDMGTTLVAASIENQKLFVAHVGDSRAYVFRQNQLKQLTTDHSYVMELVKCGSITLKEAETHPKRNIITRAIGIKEDVEVDTVIEEVYEGDKVLLCSDGLSSMVSVEEMTNVLMNQSTTEEKVTNLINIANQNGGLDNISLILIES